MKFKLFAVFVMLVGIGCSFPEPSTLSDVQKDLKERDKIAEAFDSVEGIYEGFVVSTDRSNSQPIELILTYREVAVGVDADGQIRYRPRLFGRFIRKQFLAADVKLEGVYEPATGDLTISSLASEKEQFYLRTRVRNQEISGTLRLGAQVFGAVNLRLISKQIPADYFEDEAQSDLKERERIANAYRAVEGVYEGASTSSDKTHRQEFRITVAYREVAVGVGADGQIRYRPRIFGRLHRKNSLAADIRLEGLFEPSTNDLTLSSIASEKEEVYLRSKVTAQHLIGTLRLGAQVFGEISLKLVSKNIPTDASEDDAQRNRVRQAISSLAGNYDAYITDIQMLTSGFVIAPFKVDTFNVRIVEPRREEPNSLPRAQLAYRGFPEFLVVSSSIEFRPEQKPAEISFGTPRGGPGQETMDFFGNWNNGVIEGQIVYPTFYGKLRAVKKK